MVSKGFIETRSLGPLPRILEARGGTRAVERVFRKEGVPLWLAYDQRGFLPLRSLLGLMEHAARELGDDLLGLCVGEAMQPSDLGLWAKYVMSSPDLRTLLPRSVHAMRYHATGGEMSVETVGAGFVRWGVQVLEPLRLGRRQHADHAIPPMLTALRHYLGPAWAPTRIEFEYDRPSCWRTLEDHLCAPVVFGARTNAVVFEACLLASPVLQPTLPKDAITLADLRRTASQGPPRTTIEATRETIKLRLFESNVDIQGAAKLLGIGARTLQRQLSKDNFTYRDLVEQMRMERAFDLLREAAEPITEIALAVGYSDIANFTRAFRRWAGLPPSHVRRKVLLESRAVAAE